MAALLSNIPNEDISYDDHGDTAFNVPFEDIPARDISIYLQLDTRVGRHACGQTCAHCFYIRQPTTRNRSMPLDEGVQVTRDLKELGFNIFPMISDSFASQGEFLRLFGQTHMRDFRQTLDCVPTKTMERGQMWTSGKPLLNDNWQELLCLGIENGFGSVTITFHGLLDDNIKLLPHKQYPIAGTFPGSDCEEVIRHIHQFNADLKENKIPRLVHLSEELRQPLDINIGVTIGTHNHGREALLRYAEYFNKMDVDVVRFNCFHDHGFKHPHLTLTPDQVAQSFKDFKWLHENKSLKFQLGLDEDFGTNGIEVMEFPAHTGWCRAGRQLFAIVPTPSQIVSDDGNKRVETIGLIAGCVDAFEPILGQLVRETWQQQAQTITTHRLAFDYKAIDDLNEKRRNGTYKDGCFAPEMLKRTQGHHEQKDPSRLVQIAL